MFNIKRGFNLIAIFASLFKLIAHYLFKYVHMKYAFEHVSKSYQTFKRSDSGLKNKSMTARKPDLDLKIVDRSGLNLTKASSA